MQRVRKTSVEIPEELYEAFKRMGDTTLSLLVRDAMRDHIGIKGASEDALAVLQLKYDRLIEERLHYEKKLQRIKIDLEDVLHQLKYTQKNIEEREIINLQAKTMNDEMNPLIRAMKYKIPEITPEVHEIMLKLKNLGINHTLESLQKHSSNLEQADWLLGGFVNG